MTCAPSFFPGTWDAVIAPAQAFFSTPQLKRLHVLVYGPAHLMRAAWLAGASDYLKEPWTAEELFLGAARTASGRGDLVLAASRVQTRGHDAERRRSGHRVDGG